MLLRLTILALVLLSPACAAASDLRPVQPLPAAALAPVRFRAVLVAGDGRFPVFDNAVDAVAARLQRRGAIVPGGLQRLSATPGVVARKGVRSASLGHVLDAIRAMRPGSGEGCFVFATSHGAPDRGLALGEDGETLGPAALDRALARGCGSAPTVVIVSGCFSGTFAQAPMARANRIIFTAARADRASFGCGAGRTYTVYDRCLLDALNGGGTWKRAYGSVQRCVAEEERSGRFQRSHPQAFFGAAVAGWPLPGR